MEFGGDIAACGFIQEMIKQHGEGFVQDYLATMGDTVLSVMQAAHEQAGIVPDVRPEVSVEVNLHAEPPAKLVNRTERKRQPIEAQKGMSILMETSADDSARTETDPLVTEVTPERLFRESAITDTLIAERERDIQEVLSGRLEATSHAVEPGAVEPRLQPDTPLAPQKVTAETVSELELPLVAVPVPADIGTVQMERPETEDIEPVKPTPEVLPTEETEFLAPLSEEIGAPEIPASIVELLAEPLPSPSLELEAEGLLLELGAEPTTEPDTGPMPPFSVQLEKLVAETVEPERQEMVEALIAQVYELVAQAGEESEPLGTVDLEQAADTPEATAELEEAVTELLQELGVEELSPEQVERFIALVRADQRRAAATEGKPAALPSTHDLSQSFTNVVLARYQAFMRLHHPLGRAALAQPIAA
jgi:hypothetical protein